MTTTDDKKTEVVHTRITPKQLIDIQKQCMKRGITQSDYFRAAIGWYRNSAAVEGELA